ncbi:MAG: FAD-binding oxidoreductase [Desulfatitalea sp.]
MELVKEKLMKIVGKEHVSDDPKTLGSFAADTSFVMKLKPWFVVQPADAKQIQELIGWANETKTPLVPVSSGPPHFYGDTVPGVPGYVLVDLGRMNKILRIDKRNRMVVVEPSVTYGQLESALAKEGLRVTMPLLPKANKSVIASLLERQPTVIPRYQYSVSEPLRACGVIFGNGDVVYTGDAGNGPLDLEQQWKSGMAQVDPKGPNATDFLKILTGSQGTMGIVIWASIKCEILPSIHKLLMVPADELESLMDFSYKIQKQRMGDEVLLVNNFQLANMLGQDADRIAALRKQLPQWVMLIGVAGRALFPEEKVEVMQKDIEDAAQHSGLKIVTGLPGTTSREILNALLNPSPEKYWKLKYKGGFQDIFFLTTLDQTPQFIQTMYAAADAMNYPATDIGIYIQPQHQGAVYHCEFNLPYDPSDQKETAKIKELYEKASRLHLEQKAYYSRPYGMWADMVYLRDADSTATLRKIKKIFDPNHIMNPGKLCFN